MSSPRELTQLGVGSNPIPKSLEDSIKKRVSENLKRWEKVK